MIGRDLDGTVGLLGLLADPTRLRLLALLEDAELSVAELTRVTDLPQSRVSTHLGKLRAAGLLCVRKQGTSTHYRLSAEATEGEAASLWTLVRERSHDAVLDRDRERREAALLARAEGGWPDEVAGAMEHHYSPGRTWEATARGILGLLRLGEVLDLGSGDGVLASLLASRARRVTCLDRSAKVIDAARRRLSRHGNVELVQGDMHALPFDDASFDQVLCFHALTYSARPREALAEAFRVLRPDGDLVVVTLREHAQPDTAAAYSHVNAGFQPGALQDLLEDCGFAVSTCDVTSRERRKPWFEVVSAFARRPGVAETHAVAL